VSNNKQHVNCHYCHLSRMDGCDECTVQFSGGMADVLSTITEQAEEDCEPSDYPVGRGLYLGEDGRRDRRR